MRAGARAQRCRLRGTCTQRWSVTHLVFRTLGRFVSNSRMEHADLTEQRLTELEIKASFTEDLLDRLDQVIVRQQQQIDLLIREVTLLRQPPAEVGVARGSNARDELPPHY